jgi:hypothetical protein
LLPALLAVRRIVVYVSDVRGISRTMISGRGAIPHRRYAGPIPRARERLPDTGRVSRFGERPKPTV